MTTPDFDTGLIYKSPTIQSQIRAAIELNYPVFSGAFEEEFDGAALDSDKWFSVCPSWGTITVGSSVLNLSVTDPAGGISPPWVQSRHNLAFPLRRDTDWYMVTRVCFPVVTGFGVWMCVCGVSFRDAEAIWAVKADGAGGTPGDTNRVRIHFPYAGPMSPLNSVPWSTAGNPASWRKYRLDYNALAQTYTARVDEDDDVVDPNDPDDPGWEFMTTIPVADRYADALVIGNSVAIQGHLGPWTQIQVDYVRIYGTAETVIDPAWAAPFTYDGTRFSHLPAVIGGRVSIDKDNIVDAAELELANRGLAEDANEDWQLYTSTRFWNRRCLIEGRAGDGNGKWAPWEILFDGKCAERQVRIENGNCTLAVPMRDRNRAVADDMEILGCYSDAPAAIPGVGMNMTCAEIIEDLYGVKCGLPASAYSVVATPNNVPRNYNIFRQSGQQAVKTLCDQAALAVYQNRATGQILVAEWFWGAGAAAYAMSTAEELLTLEWTESAFDLITGQQLSFENTNGGGILFQTRWPPHKSPWYGRIEHETSVATQTHDELDVRHVDALMWWAKNRKLGSVVVTALAQFWVSHDDEVRIRDDRFLGIDDVYIVDGWEHTWNGEGVAQTTIRMINPHIDQFVRANLMP